MITAPAPLYGAAAGFTLIEVIVALVILSAVMIGFLEFLSTSFRAAYGTQLAALTYDRDQNALELASALNPMQAPEGSLGLGTYHIHWLAQQIGALRQSTGYPSGRGRFAVALYRVTLDFPDSPGVAPVVVTRLGFRRDDAAVGGASR